MPNSKEVFEWIANQVTIDESPDELKSIIHLLMEHQFEITRSQILANVALDNSHSEQLKAKIERINKNEPIQYIIGSQDFYGRSFLVNCDVLIPRPETEHLVTCVIDHVRKKAYERIRILDIGTGSGCLPITLELELKNVTAIGIDNSLGALATATRNNKLYATSVQFQRLNILNDPLPELKFDIVVSNPPYVREKEKAQMKRNVLDFEPPEALFVPDHDPLIFYRAISEKSKGALSQGGLLAMEINEKFGNDVSQMLKGHGYSYIEIIKDFAGKDRIVIATNE